jgi:hypothetical protein
VEELGRAVDRLREEVRGVERNKNTRKRGRPVESVLRPQKSCRASLAAPKDHGNSEVDSVIGSPTPDVEAQATSDEVLRSHNEPSTLALMKLMQVFRSMLTVYMNWMDQLPQMTIKTLKTQLSDRRRLIRRMLKPKLLQPLTSCKIQEYRLSVLPRAWRLNQ